MTRSLPSKPSLEQLKKQARNVLKSHKSRDTSCCAVLKNLYQFKDKPDSAVMKAEIGLQEVHHALAMEYGFKSWGEMKKTILGRTDSLKYLHIHCGDWPAKGLQNSLVAGDVHVWREIYVEGPVLGNVPTDTFRRARADYLSNSIDHDTGNVLQGINARYDMLANAGKYGEVVLWFDSCLFDQTIMIHLLDQCANQKWDGTELSLICVDLALGELTGDELFALMDRRNPVTAEETVLAHDAWGAFTSADPTNIERVLKGDCFALPYLADALHRHMEQYPSVHNGLNRTQNQVLKAVASGAAKLGPLFVAATTDAEERPFMGDGSLWRVIDALADGENPLLGLTGPGRLTEHVDLGAGYDKPSLKDLRKWSVSITGTGIDVLEGRQDFIRLNGIDTWIGGVHLQGAESQWRWDEESNCLMRANGTPIMS